MPRPADSPRCPARPGKIIAIHLSYASRADQRGRRPAQPSYFLKPSSSVAASGGTIERPAGTELLAFEGEIALVIGTAARRVPLADAWEPRRLGHRRQRLRPLRPARERQGLQRPVEGRRRLHADRSGAHRRPRRRPGGAAAAHLGERRARQDDTTAGLLFPLPQLVADLSQHFTLEPGDVILTGTPAGSSVVVPGDVVEVEVDAPGRSAPDLGPARDDRDAGRRQSFDPALGSLPAVDDTQRAEAWGVPRGRRPARAAGSPDDAGR